MTVAWRDHKACATTIKQSEGCTPPPPEGEDWECLGGYLGERIGTLAAVIDRGSSPWPSRQEMPLPPLPHPRGGPPHSVAQAPWGQAPNPNSSLGPADRTGRGLAKGEGGLPVLPPVANPTHQNGAEGHCGGPTGRWASTGRSIPTRAFPNGCRGESVQPAAARKASGYGGEK